MSPVFAKRLPLLNKWNTPIDFGKKYNSKRILGDNKTWRGIIFGTVTGGIIGWIIYLAEPNLLVNISLNQYFSESDAIIVGASLGFGALFGDAVESFFKRQKKIKSGNSWFPFDQVDYILGGLVLVYPFFGLTSTLALQVLLIYFFLHLIISYIGYVVGLKDKPI